MLQITEFYDESVIDSNEIRAWATARRLVRNAP